MKNLANHYPNKSAMRWIVHVLAITGVLGILASTGCETVRQTPAEHSATLHIAENVNFNEGPRRELLFHALGGWVSMGRGI